MQRFDPASQVWTTSAQLRTITLLLDNCAGR
jgi:hypothetical protein